MSECEKRGPYLPYGDTDWVCLTHDVLLEPTRPFIKGKSYSREEMRCPVGEPDVSTTRRRLPPYDPESACLMCGGGQVAREFKERHTCYPESASGCYDGAHLQRRCHGCGFRWPEAVLGEGN